MKIKVVEIDNKSINIPVDHHIDEGKVLEELYNTSPTLRNYLKGFRVSAVLKSKQELSEIARALEFGRIGDLLKRQIARMLFFHKVIPTESGFKLDWSDNGLYAMVKAASNGNNILTATFKHADDVEGVKVKARLLFQKFNLHNVRHDIALQLKGQENVKEGKYELKPSIEELKERFQSLQNSFLVVLEPTVVSDPNTLVAFGSLALFKRTSCGIESFYACMVPLLSNEVKFTLIP